MEKILQTKNYLLIGFLITISLRIYNCRPVGFSYAKFSGPVSGPEKEIYVKDGHGRSYVDYIQKPDYSFAYGVDDPKTKVLQNRKESRHGDAVKGEYSVVDPDGTLRVVKYTADKKNGFQAEVITDGKSQMHGQDISPNNQQHHQTSYYHHPNPQTEQQQQHAHQHQQQHPPPPPPEHQQHQQHETPDHSYNDYDHYSHHEEPEPEYNQNVEAPSSAAYTSNTRHPVPANTQYHQGEYSGEKEEEDEYDDGSESGEDDDDESGEADDESGEDDY